MGYRLKMEEKYRELRSRILGAQSGAELEGLAHEVCCAGFADDDRFCLLANIRARSGNYTQFKG